MSSAQETRNAGYNVVLVIFDTLRKDVLGCYEDSPDWGPDFPPVRTPHLDAFAADSVKFTRCYPESLPTLCARRALYTGQRTFPFHNGDIKHKGDFVGAFGWGPIPEEQHTLAEILSEGGFRTGLISDLYHEFKPSKNYWRGFHQWNFIRGQETDPARSGPVPTEAELNHWVPPELRDLRRGGDKKAGAGRRRWEWFFSLILQNMKDRDSEEQWTSAQVMQNAAQWLEQNRDARDSGERIFLTVECFDPHEPWFVPRHYRNIYDPTDGPEQVISPYAELPDFPAHLVRRTRANYAGLVTMIDRWFGHLMDGLRAGGWLDDTIVIVTADHGHSLHERNYIGKRGYPASPEIIDTPLLVRHPEGLGAGTSTNAWVQHHDVAATILDAAGVLPPAPIDGRSFWPSVTESAPGSRDHVVVGWGSAMTIVDERWWLNCKVNGRGALLHDRSATDLQAFNHADDQPEVVRELFTRGIDEANSLGGFPDFLLADADNAEDAPGCSPYAAIPLRDQTSPSAPR